VGTNAVIRFILGTAIVASTTAVAGSRAEESVRIQIPGRYYSEPASVNIMVAVQPNQQNRLLRVEADGDNFFRSSDIELNGEEGGKYHTMWFKNLPAGQYTVRATVLSGSGEVAQAQAPLLVISNR
jgi:hypothetical protein